MRRGRRQVVQTGTFGPQFDREELAAKIADLIVSHSEAEENDEQDVHRGF